MNRVLLDCGTDIMTEPYVYTYERRIYFRDTDAGGVSYYANYLQYFEEARAEYIRSIGFTLQDLVDKNCVFVVREAHVEYLAPARLDDSISVDTWISDRTKVTLLFEYHVWRESNGQTESLTRGWTKLAACQFKRDGRIAVTRMPSWITGPLDEAGVPRT